VAIFFQAHAFIRTLQQTSSMFWIADCLFLLLKEQKFIEQGYDETPYKGDCQEVHLKGQTLSELQVQQDDELRSNPMYWYAKDNAPHAPFKVRTFANETHIQKVEHLHEQEAWSNILGHVKHLAHVWHSIHSFQTLRV